MGGVHSLFLAVWTSSLSFGILLGLIGCLLLLLVWLDSTLSSAVTLLSRGVACALEDGDWSVLCCSCCGCGEVESSSLTVTVIHSGEAVFRV